MVGLACDHTGHVLASRRMIVPAGVLISTEEEEDEEEEGIDVKAEETCIEHRHVSLEPRHILARAR